MYNALSRLLGQQVWLNVPDDLLLGLEAHRHCSFTLDLDIHLAMAEDSGDDKPIVGFDCRLEGVRKGHHGLIQPSQDVRERK